MSWFSIAVALGAFVASVVVAIFAQRGLRNAGWVLVRRTRTIRDIALGPVELEGRLIASPPVRVDSSERPLVAARFRVERWVQRAKNSGWVDVATITHLAKTELRDATGSCAIELDERSLDLVCATHRWVGTWTELVAQDLELSSTLTLTSPAVLDTRVRVTRSLVEDGARAFVLGDAKKSTVAPVVEEPQNVIEAGASYREAPPKKPSAERFAIAAGAHGTLVVSSVGHTKTLFALAWRPMVALASALVLALLSSIVLVQDLWFAMLLPR